MSHINLGFTGSHGQGIEQLDMENLKKKKQIEEKKTPLSTIFSHPEKNEKSDLESINGSILTGVYVIKNDDMQKLPIDEYDPHQERELKHPTTNMETLLHLLKGSLGTGILAMPNAFFHSGYVLGIIGTLVIGLICTYCVHLLIKAEYELCKRRKISSMNFPETAKAALEEGPGIFQKCAPYAGHVVNTFLLVYQLGTCCVYVVFIASNLKAVCDYYFDPMDVRLYMVIILIPLILINYIRNLKLLAPFSTIANCITFVSFGIILYYIAINVKGLEDRDTVGEIGNIPLAIGTVLFALEAIGVILPLENNMKAPKSFGGTFGVLNQGMSFIVLLYVAMGFFGYMAYGSKVLGSITLNLPKHEPLAQSVKVMLSIAIYVTHSLQNYVAVDIAWKTYLLPRYEEHERRTLIEYSVRTLLVLVTFLLAVAIPNLELFISLFGALCLSALGIVVPAIIETGTFWYSVDRSHFHGMVFKNLLLVLFGVLALVIGTYTALSDIIKTL